MTNKSIVNKIRIIALALAFVMLFCAIPTSGINVYAVTEKEPNNNYQQSTEVPLGTENDGSVKDNDKDWYKFTIPDDGFVSLNMTHDNIETSNFYFYIVKAGKTQLKDALFYHRSVGTKTTDKSQEVALEKGTYYLVAESYKTCKYTFKINYRAVSSIEKEPNDSAAKANTLKSGTRYYASIVKKGNFGTSDEDWYKIVTDKPGRINLNFHFGQYDAGNDWSVTIYDENRKNTLSSKYYSGNKPGSYNSPSIGVPKGTTYIRVKKWGEGLYDLTANFTPSDYWETEPNNGFDAADSIKLNTKYYGADSGSYDYYKFSLSTDGYIRIPIAHEVVKNSTWYFTIYSSDQKTKIQTIEAKGTTAQTSSPPLGLEKGTYFIRVYERGSSGKTYNFSVDFAKSAYWEKELNGGFTTATRIDVDKKYSGSSKEYGDKDYYTFKLSKDETITVSLGHAHLNGYYYFYLYDKNKKQLQYMQIRAEAGNPYTTPKWNLKTGTYYIMVQPALGAAYGKEYTVTVNTGQKNKISIKNANVTGIKKDNKKTGKAVTQNPTVTLNGKTLVNGQDYVLSYKNNVSSGTATVYITGKGDYIDAVTAKFQIQGLERIYGDTRYTTATSIASRVKSLSGGDKFSSIVVTCGDNFPDALAGTYLAKVKGAPIVLTNAGKQDSIISYIKANLAKGGTVYILGGTSTVPSSFSNALKSAGIKYVRRGGSNRYETNAMTLTTAGIRNQDVIVCTGTDFPDALVGSATGKPIMIVNPKVGLTESQKNLLKTGNVKSITIIGGTKAVPTSVANQIKATTGINPNRISANNRYELSTKVAEKYFSKPTNVVVATGTNFADALAGGPLAIKKGAPLLIVSDNQSGYGYAKSYINKNNIKYGVALGGPVAISDATVSKLEQ